MSDLNTTDNLFFERTQLEHARVNGILEDTLVGADDGELFFEYRQSESVSIDDGKIKSAAFDTAQGFGLRAVAGEATGYAHSSELSEAALRRAAETVRSVHGGRSGSMTLDPTGTNVSLYREDNPLGCLLYTSPSPRDGLLSRMPSSA